MPLTTYVAGDVLTASSLNDNFTFAAANPPASAAGLTFISAGTFTTASTASLPDSTFTATFRNYKVIYHVTIATASVALSLRFRAAGSDNTTAGYAQGSAGIDSVGATKNVFNNAATSLTIGTTFSGSASFTAIVLDVLNPQIDQRTMMVGNTVFINTDGAPQGNSRHTSFNATTAFDSMTLISSVASSITGVFRVYGYSDS